MSVNDAGLTHVQRVRLRLQAAALLLVPLVMCGQARAIDFYEIQIYPVETTPQAHLQLELHSNSVTTATGSLARQQLSPYQIHETLEATYGLMPHVEIGQYFATAKLDGGQYEYAGSRTKIHFGGIGDPELSPLAFGGNIELDYMRRQAEENPLSLELRPIFEKRIGALWIIGDFAFEKPFSGPGTHDGFDFAPSGEISYDLFSWLTPALEYYGDMGPVKTIPGVQRQQHFVVPAANLHLLRQLELNLGVGFGVTRASNGVFLKSIVGWTF
jgi:hypothetical protein